MFVRQQVYKRSELHERYGGQPQSGISTPASHPLILLFTSESGERYGYRDRWSKKNGGVFLYTGQGFSQRLRTGLFKSPRARQEESYSLLQ